MDLVGDLDRALNDAGEDIVLRRKVSNVFQEVTIRAAVRLANKPDQMMSGTTQDDLKIVASMTQIKATGWPGTGNVGSAPFVVDSQIPRRGDEVIVKGMRYRLEAVNPIAVKNSVIRLVMMAKGAASGA